MAAELAPPNGEEGAVARTGRRGARRSSSRPEEEDGTCAPTAAAAAAAAATRRLDRAHTCHCRTAFDRVLAEDSPAPGADVVIPMADSGFYTVLGLRRRAQAVTPHAGLAAAR